MNAPIVGQWIDLLHPLVLRLIGPHISRRTGENVEKAGVATEPVEELTAGGLVKLIVARSGGKTKG